MKELLQKQLFDFCNEFAVKINDLSFGSYNSDNGKWNIFFVEKIEYSERSPAPKGFITPPVIRVKKDVFVLKTAKELEKDDVIIRLLDLFIQMEELSKAEHNKLIDSIMGKFMPDVITDYRLFPQELINELINELIETKTKNN